MRRLLEEGVYQTIEKLYWDISSGALSFPLYFRSHTKQIDNNDSSWRDAEKERKTATLWLKIWTQGRRN